MDVYDFQKDLFEEVKATAATVGEGSTAAFVRVATDYLINADVFSDFNNSFYMGIGKKNRKLRVDGYVLDEFDFTMNLIIADYSGDLNREVITKSIALQYFDRLFYFIEEAYGNKLYKEIEISTPASDLVELLRFHKNRIRKYKLILLLDGFMSGRINTIDAMDFNGTPIEYQIWDIERLFKICSSEIGRQNIEIDFKKLNGRGIPCLKASETSNNEYRSYLCIIPGQILADVYDSYGSLLLEGNVRSFLSTKVAVNKKIRETIIQIPENFFTYNNGVAATAMDLKFDQTEEGLYITHANDFQIINGGQTTASLSNARHKDKADLSQIYVQMKLTEIDADADKANDLVRNISRSSNSQNKVSDADFFSTHPFHIRMEQHSRRVYSPATGGAQYETKWFYERARGQYLQAQMRMTKSAKDKFVAQNPKNQVITKTDFAKVRNTWSCGPHIVSKGAQSNFMKFAEIVDEAWSKSNTGFNEKYYKDTVALVIMFKKTEWIVSHQPWFEQGYRANIVTYSLAYLNNSIRKKYPGKALDLQLIWNRQEVPQILVDELVNITKLVFDHITDPNRETINVTQWCKRESCWTKLKEIKYTMNDSISKLLLDKSEIKEEEKEAKEDQKVILGFEAQEKVLSLGAEFWKSLSNFVAKKGLLTPDAEYALRYAVRIPDSLPSASQSNKLIELLNKATSEGFKIKE